MSTSVSDEERDSVAKSIRSVAEAIETGSNNADIVGAVKSVANALKEQPDNTRIVTAINDIANSLAGQSTQPIVGAIEKVTRKGFYEKAPFWVALFALIAACASTYYSYQVVMEAKYARNQAASDNSKALGEAKQSREDAADESKRALKIANESLLEAKKSREDAAKDSEHALKIATGSLSIQQQALEADTRPLLSFDFKVIDDSKRDTILDIDGPPSFGIFGSVEIENIGKSPAINAVFGTQLIQTLGIDSLIANNRLKKLCTTVSKISASRDTNSPGSNYKLFFGELNPILLMGQKRSLNRFVVSEEDFRLHDQPEHFVWWSMIGCLAYSDISQKHQYVTPLAYDLYDRADCSNMDEPQLPYRTEPEERQFNSISGKKVASHKVCLMPSSLIHLFIE